MVPLSNNLLCFFSSAQSVVKIRMRRNRITLAFLLVTCSATLLLFVRLQPWVVKQVGTLNIQYKREIHLDPDLDQIPVNLRGLITSVYDLDGRHSDFISPECQGQGPELNGTTNKAYGFVGPFDYLPEYKNPCWLPEGSQTIKCVPYFYLLGAPKAASSDLFDKLVSHPQILSGQSKESRWFDMYRYEDPARSDWNYFEQFFMRASKVLQKSVENSTSNDPYQQKVIADGDPHYYFRSMYWQMVPGNEGCLEPRVTIISQLHHLWPKTKLVLILRHPITRLYSAYLYNAKEAHTNRTCSQFHELVQNALATWYKCLEEHTFRFCMYDERNRSDRMGAMMAGIYSRYLLDILKLFPRQQLHVVRTEDYSHNMRDTLKGIHSFLDLQPLPDSEIPNGTKVKRNKGSGYGKTGHMWEKTRKLLDDFYAPYNKELADMLDDKKYLWQDTVVKVADEIN